jgi:lipopolysaccharide transport system permease protein
VPLRLGELWAHRELLGFLTWRDISVRYKQTALGIAWAVLQPVMTMIVFSIFFGRLAGVSSDGLPYPLFAFAALVPWTLFAHSLAESSNSLVANQNLITKVYFPRLVIPLAGVAAGLVDFAIAFVILLGMLAWYGVIPGIGVVVLPLLLLLTILTALGVGLWLSAMNVRYRDVRYAIPFLSQLWLFATPIAYSSSLVPDRWQFLYGLNPMVGVITGFRWALLGSPAPGPMIWASVVMVFLILASGLFYFRRMERTFADIV